MARHKDKPEFRTTPLSPEEIAKFNILKKLSGKELARRMPVWARAKSIPRAVQFVPGLPPKYPSWTHQQAMAPAELKFPGAHITDAKEYIAEFNRLNVLKNPATARTAQGDDIAAHELALFIINDGELYRQQGYPIIQNLQRKIKRGIYDPEKAVKLWRYLADNGAKKYLYEQYSSTKSYSSWRNFKGYGIFTVPIREKTARELAEHYDEAVRSKVDPRENPEWTGEYPSQVQFAPFMVQIRRLNKWHDYRSEFDLESAKESARRIARDLNMKARVIKR